jgi:hypothetical protein
LFYALTCKYMKVYYLLFFLLSIISCNDKSLSKEAGTTTVVIDVDQAGEIVISEYFNQVEYLLLSDEDHNRLVWPSKTVVQNGKIFIQDITMNSLFIFDTKGDLLNVIAGEGKGPGEFFQMDDFQIKNENIFIQDTYLSKIIEFDQDGNFVSEEKNFYNNTNFYKGENFTLYFLSFNPDYGGFNFIIDTDGKKEGYIAIKEGYEILNKRALVNGFTSHPYTGHIYYPMPYTNEIVVFDNQGTYLKSVAFNFGKYHMDDMERLDGSTIVKRRTEELNLIGDIRSIFPFKEKHFISLSQGKNSSIYLFMDDNFNIIKIFKGFTNDLDGMHIRNIPWTYTEEKIFYRMRSTDFYNDYIKSFQGSRVEIKEGNVHDFFQKNKEDLKDDKYVMVGLKLK